MNRSELEKLSKSQLIELLLQDKKKKKPVIIRKEKKKPVIIQDKRKPVIRRKVRNLIDEPIPNIGTKILKPSMVKKIKKVVKLGKKHVENWGEWLMKVDVPRIVLDDELESFKRHISELYKTELPKQYEIIQIGEKSNKKFTTFFDIFKVEPHQSIEIDFGEVLLEIANRVIKKRGLTNGDKIRWILSHPKWNKHISTKMITISGSISSYDLINQLVNFVEYKEVPLSEVKIEIQSNKIPRGMGRLRVMKSNLNQKKSVITIKNDDTICLARAIVTAVANINKTQWTKSQLSDGFNRSRKLQKIWLKNFMKNQVLKLMSSAQLSKMSKNLQIISKFKSISLMLNILMS